MIGAEGFEFGPDDLPVRVQMPIGTAEVAGLSNGDGHERQLGSAQVVEVSVVVGGCVNRRECADQLEGVALGAAGDQGVQAVLRRQRIGHAGPAAGEGGDAPLVGVGAVGGVPGLMGAMEVADTEVDDPDRSAPRECREATGKGVAARVVRSQPERPPRVGDDKVMHDRNGLVVIQSVFGHQLRDEPGVQPAGHVMAGRD